MANSDFKFVYDFFLPKNYKDLIKLYKMIQDELRQDDGLIDIGLFMQKMKYRLSTNNLLKLIQYPFLSFNKIATIIINNEKFL